MIINHPSVTKQRHVQINIKRMCFKRKEAVYNIVFELPDSLEFKHMD